MNKERKYTFSWNLIGDIEDGRVNLGSQTSVEAYRLMQFTFRDVIEQYVGTEKTDKIFFEAGKLAGKEFYNNVLVPPKDLNDFIRQLQKALKDMKIGILRIEKADMESGEFILTVSEDLDCSGLPELDFEICTYDEGFITSLFECFTGVTFNVKEIDCWCTGDRTCRFSAKVVKYN
ncbi:4-vinyl reductase [Clostridium sp.]|uniref:4-vinyl reductase n=1 Tax=Clostridium sp. TaxID=1506 RepID=UPI002846AB41|nr:4-vinyl reductase [Clostridium sp.]MDR3597395.1 4-vinyl reductase [Clostridium sp.]